MLKVLHCADIHLDSPFSGETPERAVARREELLAGFSKIIEIVKEKNIGLVLIAGDLFDKTRASSECSQRVFSLMSKAPAQFVISPGNHDHFVHGGVYSSSDIPDNVHVFKSGDISHKEYEIDGERVRVYGYAFTQRSMETPPFRGMTPPVSDGAINILVGHGNTVSQAVPDCPITREDIRISGLDYMALGHIHKASRMEKEGECYFAYSGCALPRSFDECGETGVIILGMERKDGRFILTHERLRVSDRRYVIVRINVSGLDSDEISALAAERLADVRECDSIRVIFEGSLKVGAELPFNTVRLCANKAEATEIRDETISCYEDEKTGDLTVRGALRRVLDSALSSEDEEERRIAAMAMRYALLALDGGAVADFEGGE